jgi:hypothetical protein
MNETSTTTDNPKPGAPCGNRNAMRTGKRSRQSLVLGKPAPGTAYCVAGARAVMREAEDAVRAARSAVTLYEASVILEIGEHEVSRRLAWRLLRLKAETLTPDQQAELRRDAAKAASERNRCLKLLKLDASEKAVDVWAQIYAQPPALPAPATQPAPRGPAVVPSTSDAPAGQCGVPTEGANHA